MTAFDRYGQREVGGAVRRRDRRLIRGTGRNRQQRNDRLMAGESSAQRGSQVSGTGTGSF
jgi:hypothetical protein